MGCAATVTGCAAHRAAAPGGTAPRPAASTASTLGVLPFASAAGDTTFAPLAYAFADLLTTDLARSARLTLVERARLGDVLRELDLAAAGRVDSSTAPRVGRLLQARRLVVGSFGITETARPATAAAGTLRMGVRLADVRTGAVVEAVDAQAPLADVLAAEKALAFRLFDALGVTLTPAERAAVEQRPTANLPALLAYGRGVRDQLAGDLRAATEEFRRAQRLDPGFHAAGARAAQTQGLAERGTARPLAVPGLRAVDGALATAVDRLNNPLDAITSLARANSVIDPSFPLMTAALVFGVVRP